MNRNHISSNDNFSYFQNISTIKPNEKNIIKIANFINKNFKHIDHSFEYKYFPFEALNIFKLIEVYGYGNCKHYSILFKFFMDSIGVKCSTLYGEFGTNKKGKLQNHVYNIIELDNKKFLIDTDLGIITYNKKLIEYKGKLNHKIFNFFFKKRKKVYKLSTNHFVNVYDKKFSEKFSLNEKIFNYKLILRKFFSELYFVNIPFFNKKFKEKKVSKKTIIIKNKIIKNTINENKILQFYSIKFRVNDYFFVINNFPYLIVDVRAVSTKSDKKDKTFIFIQNGINKNYKFDHYIFRNKKSFSSPIYSFSLKSKCKIKYIEIICQKSLFKKKLIQFIKRLNNN